MSERDELKELVAQALEYARFYRDLGVTDLDGVADPGQVAALHPQATDQIFMPKKTAVPPQHPPRPLSKEPLVIDPAPRQVVPGPEPPVPSALFSDIPATPGKIAETLEIPPANETLDDIRLDLGDCRRCKLWSTRTNIVFGEGNPQARLMFVGEGPGADEDLSGRPFIGRAGQLLTKMIEAIGLSRDEVYIANVVKSRPPENRNPERDEVSACLPFLRRQIGVVRPQLIVTLGNPATQTLLETTVGITRLRGQFHDYPRLPGVRVMPTFHPAYLLRSPDKKREAWEDLKKVRDFLKQIPN